MAPVPVSRSIRDGVHRLAFLLAPAALLVLAVACGSDEEANTSQSTTAAAATTKAAAFPSIPTGTSATSAGCQAPSGTPPEVQVKSYPQRPALTIDTSHQFIAHVYTTRGHFIVQLLPDLAPEHVNSFVFLARDKFFNGTTFHRVIAGFVAQGGDPTGTGRGGPGYTVPLEASQEPFVRGVVGMARSNDPNSAGSQWFVTLGDASNLNAQYTVFGKVVQGMEVVDCLTPRDPSVNPNAPPGDAIIDLAIQEIAPGG
jgi:peptidylprolyl isomerase